MKRILSICLMVVFSTFLYGASPEDFVYDGIKSGRGIRAMSMGGAYTALAEEGPGVFYNPAGLAHPGFLYQYENLDNQGDTFDKFDAQYLYINGIVYANSTKKALNGDKVNMNVYGFGRRGRGSLDWGVTYKQIKTTVGGVSQSGWTGDLGVMLRLTPQMNVGFVAQDLFKKDVNVASSARLGVAWFTRDRKFLIDYDLVLDRSFGTNKYDSHVGFEWNLADGLTLRSGYGNERFSGGGSLILPIGEVEFGILGKRDSEDEVLYSFGVKFGKGVKPYQMRRRYALFKPRAYAEFRLDRQLIEGKSEISLLGGYKIGVNDLLSLIHEANLDKSCKGYIIRVGSVSSSLASVGLIQEVRSELLKGKEAGKEIIVYLENWATLPEYYLASVADKIVMPRLGTISHLGLQLQVMKTKDLFESFGIKTEVVATGQHKDALHGRTDELTTSNRLALEGLVEDLYHQILEDVRVARNLEWDVVKSVFDGRLIAAEDALDMGLVDALGYWDKTKDYTKDMDLESKPDLPRYPLTHFGPTEVLPTLIKGDEIAVVEVDGVIVRGSNQQGLFFGGKSSGSDQLSALLDRLAKSSVDGVILRVNSVGGSILASDQIYEAIERVKKSGKLVYTSMGTVAASGGYYVSVNSDKIYANPGTLTGSIGVISEFQNMQGLYDLLGVDMEVIKTGKYVDMFGGHRSLAEDELTMFREFQERQYGVFVGKVQEHRDLTQSEVENVAQGQAFSGAQAQQLKMVDELGSFYDAVDDMTKVKKLSSPKLLFFRDPPSPVFSFLDRLFSRG